MKKESTSYVLLSGGQDSFVCLMWALKHFARVEAIGIKYGQNHAVEIRYAQQIAQHFNVPYFLYDVGDFIKKIAESSLLGEGNHNRPHLRSHNLPASFVPNRNGFFLTIAANHAFRKEVNTIHLVTGACQTDYSGYPDCRDAYMKAKARELSLGIGRKVTIHTPLMFKTKAQTFMMAYKEGRLQELINGTMTCYNGVETLNAWGRGCDNCPACNLRKKGFEEFLKMKK